MRVNTGGKGDGGRVRTTQSRAFNAVQSRALVLLAFLVFEVCKGVYYPVVGTLRGQYIPMEVRTIISQCSKPVLGAAVLVLLLTT